MKEKNTIRLIVVVAIFAFLCWNGCDNDKDTINPIQSGSLDELAPGVTITEPDSGAMVPEGEYCHVVAEAWDDVGVVVAELFIDNVKWGEDLRYPYEFDFMVSVQNVDHTYTIFVRVADAAGNSRRSDIITVTSYNPGR